VSAAPRQLDVILFDADGVLQRAPADIRLRLAAALGARPDDAEVCMAEIFAAEAPALAGTADFSVAILPVLTKWKAPSDAAVLLGHWQTVDVDQGVLALIGELRLAGIVCALASNQEAHRARRMSVDLGYGKVFDREFYSCDLGHTKPSVSFFTEIIRLSGYDAARTLFIDDRADNVAAARQAGLLAAQFVLGEVGTGAAPLRALLARYGVELEPAPSDS
jgi:putative hydrolase of the HAD superfamily